jgi:hypothetical protein
MSSYREGVIVGAQEARAECAHELEILRAELEVMVAAKNQYFDLAAQYARELRVMRDVRDQLRTALQILEDGLA